MPKLMGKRAFFLAFRTGLVGSMTGYVARDQRNTDIRRGDDDKNARPRSTSGDKLLLFQSWLSIKDKEKKVKTCRPVTNYDEFRNEGEFPEEVDVSKLK